MHGGIGMTDEFDIGLFLKRAHLADLGAVRKTRRFIPTAWRQCWAIEWAGRRGYRPANSGNSGIKGRGQTKMLAIPWCGTDLLEIVSKPALKLRQPRAGR